MTRPDATSSATVATPSPAVTPTASHPGLSRPVMLAKLSQWSVRWLPPAVVQTGLQTALNTLFKTAVTQGELNFLAGRSLCVAVTDIELVFTLTLKRNRLRISSGRTSGDVLFSAALPDLIRIAAGAADPDTLFFRRRLQVSGDTELGLAVKNLLGRFDAETVLPGPLHRALQQLAAAL